MSVERSLPDTRNQRVPGGSLLEVSHLSCAFETPLGARRVVDDVSFTVERGRTLGIVGESGSGKSMLTRSVLGLAPPSASVSGEVRFDGQSTASLTPRQRRDILGRRMAVVFQDPMTALNPVLRIGRQLVEPMRLHLGMSRNDAYDRAGDLLRQVGVPDPVQKLRQYPHQLSGGLRQRVTIAAALACDPEILFADEATTALDVTVQRQILDLLGEIQSEREMAMVVISHDLGVIAGRTDEVAVMYGGQLVERLPTRDLLDGHRHPYSRALLESVVRKDHVRHGRFRSIPGAPPTAGELPGCPFAPRCSEAQAECAVQRPSFRPVADGSRFGFSCHHPIEIGGRSASGRN